MSAERIITVDRAFSMDSTSGSSNTNTTQDQVIQRINAMTTTTGLGYISTVSFPRYRIASAPGEESPFVTEMRPCLTNDADIFERYDGSYWKLSKWYQTVSKDPKKLSLLRTCVCARTEVVDPESDDRFGNCNHCLWKGWAPGQYCGNCWPFDGWMYESDDEPTRFCVQADTHTWRPTNEYESWAFSPADNPAGREVVAFDCEMVETEAPNGKKEDSLISLTAIDVLTNEVLVNCIVRPEGEITNYRESKSGFSREVLEKAEAMAKVVSLAEAQAQMMSVIDRNTFLVGWSISNDLNSTRIFHPRIFDLQLHYKFETGFSRGLPRLDRAAGELGLPLQRGAFHASLEDTEGTAELCRRSVGPQWFKDGYRQWEAAAAEEERAARAKVKGARDRIALRYPPDGLKGLGLSEWQRGCWRSFVGNGFK